MFVGHYGVSCGVKSRAPEVPLWVLFIAVQLLDVFWSIFVLLGIERVRIVPGFTKANPLDLYYMPYTHSLVGACVWALLAALAYRVWRGSQGSGALLVGAAVLSHWLLDLPMHRPDLPLFDNRMKMGLGLWNYPVPALALEAAVLLAGVLLYTRSTRAHGTRHRYDLWVFTLALIAVQVALTFGPLPGSSSGVAALVLGSYLLLAFIAHWIAAPRVVVSAAS